MSRHAKRFGLLDRYILKELSSSFLFGVTAFTMVFVAGDLLFQAANLMIDKGISLAVVMRLFLYRLPEVVSLTLPMASLLSSLLTFSRLSTNSELVALKAAGIPFHRILRPVFFASILVGFAALISSETIVPFSNRAAENLMKYEILKEKPSMLKEKVFLREESGGVLNRVIYLNELRARDGSMKDVIIQEFDKGRLSRISLAEDGLWKDGEWWLEDGQVFEVTADGKVNPLFRFERQKLMLGLTPGQVEKASRQPAEMSSAELLAQIALLRKEGANLTPLEVMFHLRLALPWASVVLAILGASLGVRSGRSGPGIGFGLSVLIVFAYYVTMSFCRALGEAGYLLPLISAWIPNVTFLLVGGFFARRANG
ncbi:MAG: YjgP/YjgQ family permease [Synergistaceae bacterium]|nr:YjgP/YjgQ family permease [Synergistaceae bacterium]